MGLRFPYQVQQSGQYVITEASLGPTENYEGGRCESSVRGTTEVGIARWKDEVGRTIGILEAAKKVILARLGPVGTSY